MDGELSTNRADFCTGLHGLTRQAIYSLCEQRISNLKSMEHSSRTRRKGRAATDDQIDNRGEIEFIQRLLQYVVYDDPTSSTSQQEADQFASIKNNVKEEREVKQED